MVQAEQVEAEVGQAEVVTGEGDVQMGPVEDGPGVQEEEEGVVVQDDGGGGEAADQGTVRNLEKEMVTKRKNVEDRHLWKFACSWVSSCGRPWAMSPLLSPRMRAAAHSSDRRLLVSREALLG